MPTSSSGYFIEVGQAQEKKARHATCGDVFFSQSQDDGRRVVSVLADGLGSGIKASVLATMTATMAAKYIAGDADIGRAAQIILQTLPVCSERKVAYSTFTIVDMDRWGETRIIEYDNPPFLLVHNNDVVSLPTKEIRIPTSFGRDAIIREARFTAMPGDRIVICSDGITQAGVGQHATPLGWGSNAEADFIHKTITENPNISARQLAKIVVQQAFILDGRIAKDDTTCGVIYFRKPREVLVLTGAPVHRDNDVELARRASNFDGRKIICGGTTASILSREFKTPIKMDLSNLDPHMPPISHMSGFDLVTEGAITLAATARILDEHGSPDCLKQNAATKLANVFLDSDIIHIIAGTKINEALQDPSLPQDLDIRRNILRRLKRVLKEKHLKEVQIEFI
ncbi:MAG: serine/threonine-protein phosphatase [Holophagaceae bacterium]|nr:serine/threonine-protein phosphatase [Holophagaceae bacterium]